LPAEIAEGQDSYTRGGRECGEGRRRNRIAEREGINPRPKEKKGDNLLLKDIT